MDLRFYTAKFSASILKTILRLIGSGGTAAPGLLASRIDPNALKKLNSYISDTVLVTGTNVKTTTSRIIGATLKKAGIPYIHNREGSNLVRGVIGSLLNKTPIFTTTENNIPLL